MKSAWRPPVLFAVVLAAAALAGCAAKQAGMSSGGAPAAVPAERVLVAGGSGRAGRYVVEQLRESGVPFRALTRSRATAIERLGPEFADVDWIECDVRDPVRVREALRGITHVISVIGANEVGGDNSAEFVDYGGVKNLVDASVDEGVRRFVLLTAIGVTDPSHPFNKATKGALGWRFRGEEVLRESGLEYTIVRPAGLVNTPAGQQGLRLDQGDHWRPVIRSTLSRDDLADVLIEALHNPGARNATFELLNDPARQPGEWRAGMATLRPDPPRSAASAPVAAPPGN